MARPGTERLYSLRTANGAVQHPEGCDVDGDELGPLGPGDRCSGWRDTAVEFGDRELATGIRRGLNE